MSRKCNISGKGPNVANKVSHANNRKKTRQKPNLQTKRLYVPEEDRWVKVRLSNRALRTVTKKGLLNYLDSQGLRLKDVTV